MVPGASLPSNGTVSRGIGVATGCNCESSALANTWRRSGAEKKAGHQAAARIRLRRMIFPVETFENPNEHAATPPLFGAIRWWRNYGGR